MAGTKGKSGGARAGAGNKPGVARVDEKRKQYPLSMLPSVMDPFITRYGKDWRQQVEEWIIKDMKKPGK